jgi:hypothetical protein
MLFPVPTVFFCVFLLLARALFVQRICNVPQVQYNSFFDRRKRNETGHQNHAGLGNRDKQTYNWCQQYIATAKRS